MKIETTLNLSHSKIQLDRILAESQLWQKWVLVNLRLSHQLSQPRPCYSSHNKQKERRLPS